MQVIAVDVAKRDLVVFDGTHIQTIPNEQASIEKLLKSHPGSTIVAEPTSSYHLELVYAAHERGHTVHLVNPKEMRNYKDSRSFRAKTDPLDARYLYEFATAMKASFAFGNRLSRMFALCGPSWASGRSWSSL